jgi:hypothetical protein
MRKTGAGGSAAEGQGPRRRDEGVMKHVKGRHWQGVLPW